MSRIVVAVAYLNPQCGLPVQCDWSRLYPKVILHSSNASHCAWCDRYDAAEAWQHDGRPLNQHHVPMDFRGCASQCDQAEHLIIIIDGDVMLESSVQLLAAKASLYRWSSECCPSYLHPHIR